MNRLITFGDSWTFGHCQDLIDNNLQSNNDDVCYPYPHPDLPAFKKCWPAVVSDQLGIGLDNKAMPGNSNKAIITQLYDHFVFDNFTENDLVIVLLSTWHRSYTWSSKNNRNLDLLKSKFCPESSARYVSTNPGVLKDGTLYHGDLNKLAYDTFFDFFTIKNFLENLHVKFYIGWGFTYINDFSPYLNYKYVNLINNTKNLLDPMMQYCKVNPNNLMHPTLLEHKVYGNYVYNRIVNGDN